MRGSKGKVCYLACLCVYIYGALWAYGSVFASACAATLPVPHLHDSYPLYLALFALLVWPLSCLELTEQARLRRL
jgi:amino acid permease